MQQTGSGVLYLFYGYEMEKQAQFHVILTA